MSATVGADNFRSRHTQSVILMSGDGAGNAVKVRRPAASRLELVVGLVKRSAAACAGVNAFLGVVLVKLSGTGGFSSLFSENTELLC